jgi:hypothetical protein
MPYDISQLLGMSEAELDELFSKIPSGDIPDGEANGTAIIAPGTVFSKEIAAAINLFAWQGKTFDAKAMQLKNRITPFGLNEAGMTTKNALSWTIQRLPWSRTGFATKFA